MHMAGVQPYTLSAHPALENLAVKCRPFKLVRELPSIVIVAVYTSPRASAQFTLEKLYCLISEQMNANIEAAVIVAGDFNYVEVHKRSHQRQ